MGQGYQYAVSIVTGFKDALKPVTSWNAEERQRKMKMKNVIKETGKVLLFGIGVNAPFWAYMMGWI